MLSANAHPVSNITDRSGNNADQTTIVKPINPSIGPRQQKQTLDSRGTLPSQHMCLTAWHALCCRPQPRSIACIVQHSRTTQPPPTKQYLKVQSRRHATAHSRAAGQRLSHTHMHVASCTGGQLPTVTTAASMCSPQLQPDLPALQKRLQCNAAALRCCACRASCTYKRSGQACC